jgi:F-type H+-transporting ATPase subunit b
MMSSLDRTRRCASASRGSTPTLLSLLCGISVLLLATLTPVPSALAEPQPGAHEEGHGTEAEGHHAAGAHPSAAHAESGEGHHDPSAQAEGGEGHHAVTHLDNWFSLSFGPDKAHKNGPFAFAILNFILLVWIVVKFGRKPFREYLRERHASIKQNLEEASALHQQARAKLDEIESKLKNISREIAEIRESVLQDAELEKTRIIQQAELEAERIVKQADETLKKELHRARRRLEVEAVNAAMQAADKLVRQQVNESDRKRLNEEYFSQILSGGGKN